MKRKEVQGMNESNNGGKNSNSITNIKKIIYYQIKT